MLIPYHSLCFFFRQLFAGSGLLIYNKWAKKPVIPGWWLVRPAEILLLSYSSLALDLSFFVLVFSSSQAYYISALYRSNCPINMVVELLPYVGASRSRRTIFKESFCWGTASRHRWRLVKQLVDLDFWNSARQDQRTNVSGRGKCL